MNATSTSGLGWYARRAARMSPAEMAWRARDQALQAAWSPRQVKRGQLGTGTSPPSGPGRFTATLPPDTAARVPEQAKTAVREAADRLMRGEWEVLGVVRTDLVQPDWFHDPVTGRRSSPDRYAFRIDHRSEEENGNIKQIWEISRCSTSRSWRRPGSSPARSLTRAGWPTSCVPGGGRIPSCRAFTGRAESRSVFD